MSVVKTLFGGVKPASMAAMPAAPTASGDNTSAAVAEQARPGPGREGNISAGADPSLQSSSDPYSVRKKLLGM